MLDLSDLRSSRMLGYKQSLSNRSVNVMQSFFVQHTFSISLGICLQWPHLHQSGTRSVGCLGLSIVGSLSGNVSCATERNCSATYEGPGISLALKSLIGEPCAFTEGPLQSFSAASNWLWTNLRLPMPRERTVVASLRTLSSPKFCMKFSTSTFSRILSSISNGCSGALIWLEITFVPRDLLLSPLLALLLTGLTYSG